MSYLVYLDFQNCQFHFFVGIHVNVFPFHPFLEKAKEDEARVENSRSMGVAESAGGSNWKNIKTVSKVRLFRCQIRFRFGRFNFTTNSFSFWLFQFYMKFVFRFGRLI